MALIDDFKTRFPEFDSGEVDAAWSNLEGAWPCYYNFEYGSSNCTDEAIFQLIAHLFVVSSSIGSDPSLAVSGQSVGSVSQTFSTPQSISAKQTFFGSTKYGQQFLMLIAARQGAFFV